MRKLNDNAFLDFFVWEVIVCFCMLNVALVLVSGMVYFMNILWFWGQSLNENALIFVTLIPRFRSLEWLKPYI